MKYANGAVADVILLELEELLQRDINDEELKKHITDLYNDAYNCFVRLNCPLHWNIWQSAKIKQNFIHGKISEVEALCAVFMALKGIRHSKSSRCIPWEQKMLLLSSAVKDAQTQFPSLAQKSASLTQKRKRKHKESSEKVINATADKDNTTERKIIVKVPSQSVKGDKFRISLTCGYFKRNIQLQAANTKKIMFHYPIPNDAGSDIHVRHISSEDETCT